MWYISKKILLVFYTLLVIIAVSLLALITIPIALYRQLGKLFVTTLYRDSKNILKIVEPTSQIVAHDHRKPHPRFNVIYCFIGEGKMTIDNLRQLVSKQIVERNVSINKGKPKKQQEDFQYPELRCEAVSIGGYDYWKKLHNFDIADYVKEYDGEHNGISLNFSGANQPITPKELKRINSHLNCKGWEKGKSPWEFLLLHNYVNEQVPSVPHTVIIFRIHHFMADGFSIINLLSCLNTGDFKATVKPFSKQMPKLNYTNEIEKTARKILNLLSIPYEMAIALEQLLGRKQHAWKVPANKKGEIGHKINQNWSTRIPVDVIKTIKNQYGTSFAAVIASIVSGTIQNLMKSMKQNVPECVATISPAPLPGHPGTLSNYYGYILYHLPVGEEDPGKRLEKIASEFKSLENSSLPLVSYALQYLFGLHLPLVRKGMVSLDSGFSLVLTIFAGLDGTFYWGGCKHRAGFFTLGTGQGNTGATFSVYSLMEHVQFCLTIDNTVFSSEDKLEKLDAIVKREINSLL